MQNRYAGDVGDYVKYALLRHLSQGRTLGVAWYLFPDEGHNADGKHVSYLDKPEYWRSLDPDLFDAMLRVVSTERSVASIQKSGVLAARFSGEPLSTSTLHWRDRSPWREQWFRRMLGDLEGTDLVFADPDNGLVDDNAGRRSKMRFGKQMPLSEVRELAKGRTVIVYHHNSRFKGGHDAEVEYWLDRLGSRTIAIRATSYNCRTFFLVNPNDLIADRAKAFCNRWSVHKVRIHDRQSEI